jgi:hypothetical protein
MQPGLENINYANCASTASPPGPLSNKKSGNTISAYRPQQSGGGR